MEKNRQAFYDLIRRQTLQWQLIDAKKIADEDQIIKPYRPKKKPSEKKR